MPQSNAALLLETKEEVVPLGFTLGRKMPRPALPPESDPRYRIVLASTTYSTTNYDDPADDTEK